MSLPPSPIVNVLRLRQPLSYAAGLRLQQAAARRCLEATTTSTTSTSTSPPASANLLILCQHRPVYTVGLRPGGYDDAAEAQRLRQLGADYQRTNRGGLITFHGPGQLVAYPILQLRQFRPSIRWYVCALERTIIEMCAGPRFRLEAQTSPDTGVWVGDRKLCAIGVHASRYVTSHGLALNCDTDLRWFGHIVPCGLHGKGVTSLSEMLQRPVGVEEASDELVRSFARVFGCEVREVEAEERREWMRLAGAEEKEGDGKEVVKAGGL